MLKHEPKPFLYYLDFLSGTPQIFISSHKSFSTLFGLLATLLILFMNISYILYKCYLFIFEREITIVEIKDNFTTKEVKVPLNDFLFAFNVFNINMSIEYFWGKEINLQSARSSMLPLKKNYTIYVFYENPENKEIIDKYQLETEYCEIGKNINKELIEKYNFTEYKNYLCLSNKSKNFDIIINKTHNTYIDIVISIKIENEEDYGIKEIHSDNLSSLYELSFLEFHLYSPNDIISNQNMSNPIKFRKNHFSYDLVSPGVLERNDINIKFVDYSSDNGIIIKKKEKFNCFSIDSITKTTNDIQRFDEVKKIIYSEFRLYFNSDVIESYERTYQKFPAVVADISAIFSLIFTAGNILVGYLCKTFLEAETTSRIFQIKFNPSSKKKIKQNNKIIKVKNNVNNESSNKENKNNLIDYLSQKTSIMNIRGNKNRSNYEEINNKSNKLSLINNISSKKILIGNNNQDSNKKLSIHNNNSKNYENKEDNNSNSLIKNINKENNLKNYNSSQYLDVFFKMIGKRNIEKQRKCIYSRSFSFCDYFSFILNKNKNNKTKIIKILSTFLKESLSIEEIIERKIDLENLISFIKIRLGKRFILPKYLSILLKKETELKKIIEDESKNIISNKLVK